jgi:hypothetical protein
MQYRSLAEKSQWDHKSQLETVPSRAAAQELSDGRQPVVTDRPTYHEAAQRRQNPCHRYAAFIVSTARQKID